MQTFATKNISYQRQEKKDFLLPKMVKSFQETKQFPAQTNSSSNLDQQTVNWIIQQLLSYQTW